MDRLDAWINSEVGWRYTLFVWLQVCPWTVVLGWFLWGFFTQALLDPGLMTLVVAALSMLAAMPLASLIVLRRSVAIRYGSKPILSWRFFAGSLLLVALTLYDIFIFAQSSPWHRAHPSGFAVQMLLYAGALAFNCWGGHRWRQARRLAVPAGRYHHRRLRG